MSGIADEMTKLRRLLLTMSAEVEQRVHRAIDGLVRHDLRSAEEVRYGDDEIDEMDVNVEAECFEILALHQPMAGDLRFTLATLRINQDLERMGDLARSVARRSIKLETRDPIQRPEVLSRLGSSVKNIVSDAMKALADHDEALCEQVRRADPEIDALYKQVFTWAAEELQSRGELAKPVIDILSIVRALERIADLSVNICETIIFSVEGTVVRHTPVEE